MIIGLQLADPSWAADITPAARKGVVVSSPPKDEIAVPEQYRGIQEVVANVYYEGNETEEEKQKAIAAATTKADFTQEYRAGFLRGWQDFLQWFQEGAFDLDQIVDPERVPIAPLSMGRRTSYYAGQRAGALACRDELLALAKKRDLSFLPARPAWLKKLVAAGGSNSELNAAGNPTYVSWSSTSGNRPVRDDDLKLLREIPMADLESMSLTFTEVTDAGVAGLPAMPKLTRLELSGNSLTGACFRTLDRFPNLVSVEIVGPRAATVDDLAAVERLSKLESFKICAVDIGDDAIPIFLALPKLTVLDLGWAYDWSRGARLSSGALAKLSGCSHLKSLILSGCAVDDAALKTIVAGLPELSSLSLARTSVTDESIASLQKLPKLEWLRLANTRVTDTGIAALASHPSIQTLLLNETRVSDAALATLATLPKIKEICVRRGQLSEGAMDTFKKLKPTAYMIQFDLPAGRQ